jgi:hypothetical protein
MLFVSAAAPILSGFAGLRTCSGHYPVCKNLQKIPDSHALVTPFFE